MTLKVSTRTGTV